MLKHATILCAIMFGMLASTAPAQAQHAGHAAHTGSDHMNGAASEPGNGAFAAIAEIVALLSADPKTDWSAVDIDALRQHLVDMDALVKGAEVASSPLPLGLKMRVSTLGRAGEAASRMVTAHGAVLASETGWASDLITGEDHLVWTVEAESAAEAQKIQALGFFGLMATGDHHRAHHLALAMGRPLH